MSVVKWSRSEFLIRSSDRPGSKIGTSPRASDSIFSCTMSRTWTSWPSSAKQAAVTSPTQPAPITPMGSRAFMRRLTLQGLGGAGDVDHLPRGERLEQRVRDPVDGVLVAPCHQPQTVAVVEQLQLAVPVFVHLGRVVEDRRVHPGGALDAVVLAD